MEFNSIELSEKIKSKLKMQIGKMKIKPTMAIIVANNYSEASKIYIGNKIKTNNELGIQSKLIEFDWKGKTQTEIFNELKDIIHLLNSNKCINGIIVQKPFPMLRDKEIDNLIDPIKDIDGFSNYQKGSLIVNDNNTLIPATASGVVKIIESIYGEDLSNKTISIVNRSGLIGLPLYSLLLNRNATVTNIHTKTNKEFKEYMLKNSDIVILGTGNRKIFGSKDFGDKCKLIIDCSMTKVEGIKGVGDLDKEEVLENRPDIIVSSGYRQTGLLTCISLAENTIRTTKI